MGQGGPTRSSLPGHTRATIPTPWTGATCKAGNCGGALIRDLLLYFRPTSVLDPMAGSGTCPSGIAAANLLGFTTQFASRGELATSASSVPWKLVGPDALVHKRRPEAWSRLEETEDALLDFLRRGGRTSELSPEDTIRRTLMLLSEQGRYQRLADIARTEPPRVRALLGALGEQLGGHPKALAQLRESLNPLSRFDFGLFTGLPNATAWQAREHRR